MITKNVAARDVYWDVHVDPSALPDDYVAAWRLRFTWGQNYDHGASPALWHGWTLDVTMSADVSGGGTPANYEVEFESAFDSPNFSDAGSGVHEWWLRVYMDNARLQGGCTSAVLTFDELRLTRRTTAGGAETTLYIIAGPITYVNASYDPRKDVDFIQPTIAGPYASPGAATCPATPGDPGGTDATASAAMGFAWKYAVPGSGTWTEDTVEVDNTDTLYGTCPCAPAIGDITIDAPPLNTEWIALTATIADLFTTDFILTQTFTCPGSSTPITVDWYDVQRSLETHAISAYVHRKDGPMDERTIETVEVCNDDGSTTTTTTNTTVTDGYTVIRKNTLDLLGSWHTLCDYETSTGPYDPCLAPDEYLPDVDPPDPADYPDCENAVTITQLWSAADCPPTRNRLAYKVRRDLQNFRAFADSGVVTVEMADNSLSSWAAVGSTVSGDEVCLAVRDTGPILLGVIDAGAYKVYTSTGGSWTLAYTVVSTGDPVNPAIVSCADQTAFHFWNDSGTLKGRRFDASGTALDSAYSLTGVGTADIDGLDADESYGDAGTRLIRLFVREAGVNKVYTSTDGVAFV
jgi:hypothetical protein